MLRKTLLVCGVASSLLYLAIAVGAAAFGQKFRLYSISSLVVLAAFGVLTFLDAPKLSANLPTRWLGVWERINLGVFLLWIVAFATALWPAREGQPASRRAGRQPDPRVWHGVPVRPSRRSRLGA